MQKPTSKLNVEIIEFVMQNNVIQNLLNARDSHSQTFGIEITCKFYSSNRNNPRLSAYKVEFIYDTQSQANNLRDDISVMVEVTEANPAQFIVRDILSF